MKRIGSLLVVLFLLMTGCGDSKQSAEDLITVDVTASYPKKELILQDFMDVEYIALETNDEFVNQGYVQAISKKYILVKNRSADGNIFVYDRSGKALRKINHKGQGGEEYSYILGIALDEDKNEMYVHDHYIRKIQVYDLDGSFKRSLNYREQTKDGFYTNIVNYDKDHLICYDQFNKEKAFVLISKQDGSIVRKITMPFKEAKLLMQEKQDGEMTYFVTPGPYSNIIPHEGNFVLLELSTDTVYSLSPDYNLHPLLVRNPPIRSMNPEVFLILRMLSDRYYFMETVKNVWDFGNDSGFPRTFFMYDRQDKSFYEYTVYNGDYSTSKEFYMNDLRHVNQEIESWRRIEAYQLVEANEKGELKGQLKEIAATLDEEANPVIMLIKHKKQ